MRVALFGNGRPAARIVRYLRRSGDHICGLVLHPEDQQRDAGQILGAFGEGLPPLLEANASREEDKVGAALRNWAPQLLVSVFYGFIIPQPLLDCAASGGINLHPSYLPYHRGRHPNVWTLVERTPAGATIHHMAGQADSGDVIARTETVIRPADTAQTLYSRLEDTCVALFEDTWPAIRAGTAPRISQADLSEQPCSHRARDLGSLDEIDLDATYTGRELLNLLRARTFPPHPSAWFRDGGHKISVQVKLTDDGPIDAELEDLPCSHP